MARRRKKSSGKAGKLIALAAIGVGGWIAYRNGWVDQAIAALTKPVTPTTPTTPTDPTQPIDPSNPIDPSGAGAIAALIASLLQKQQQDNVIDIEPDEPDVIQPIDPDVGGGNIWDWLVNGTIGNTMITPLEGATAVAFGAWGFDKAKNEWIDTAPRTEEQEAEIRKRAFESGGSLLDRARDVAGYVGGIAEDNPEMAKWLKKYRLDEQIRVLT